MAGARKRSITDDEIAIIKAMFARGFRNEQAHHFFNRPGRYISSGRFAEIRSGTYGRDVAPAAPEDLDKFLKEWDSSYNPLASTSPIDQRALSALFEERATGKWFLRSGETDTIECKEGFRLKPLDRFANALRAIAALANNSGGYILFGVRDGTFEAVGLPSDDFEKTDSGEFSRQIGAALDPVPEFAIGSLKLGSLRIGAIHVRPSDHAPVMATKSCGGDLQEGAIYYRYVGQSKPIKPGELRRIIARREHDAVAQFSERMGQFAAGQLASLDLETGTIAGRGGALQLDERLLPKLKFVREGEFTADGSEPTLKLMGDLKVMAGAGPSVMVLHRSITDEVLLQNFIKQEKVGDPLGHILHIAHSPRAWLPLFYFASLSGQSVSEILDRLKAEPATFPKWREKAIARLRGRETALADTPGRPRALRDQLMAGNLTPPTDEKEASRTALAITALTSWTGSFSPLLSFLATSADLTAGESRQTKSLRSSVYRAACRVDELMYGAQVLTGAANTNRSTKSDIAV